ncbi:hypothetical protein C8R44DRAFT_878313 [Mycena epipterygia]|nr:hypothetical protein C8R44DRAFT_878313 [Mycena epipterygia]
MPHKLHRSVHRTAIFLGVLLVLILAHLVFLLAQSPSSSHGFQPRLRRAEGRWVDVRRSLRLPPLAAHAKPRSNMPPLSLPMASRFDLKRKRALEESLSAANAQQPPQLYFAADALLEGNAITQGLWEGLHGEDKQIAKTASILKGRKEKAEETRKFEEEHSRRNGK